MYKTVRTAVKRFVLKKVALIPDVPVCPFSLHNKKQKQQILWCLFMVLFLICLLRQHLTMYSAFIKNIVKIIFLCRLPAKRRQHRGITIRRVFFCAVSSERQHLSSSHFPPKPFIGIWPNHHKTLLGSVDVHCLNFYFRRGKVHAILFYLFFYLKSLTMLLLHMAFTNRLL